MTQPIKLRMLTVAEGEEIELIFDAPAIESLADISISENHFGSFLKLNIQKSKAPSSDRSD